MNANTEFEIKANAFKRMTGMMAPGKDEPAASHGHSYEERQAAWANWHTQHLKIIRALLHALDDILNLG